MALTHPTLRFRFAFAESTPTPSPLANAAHDGSGAAVTNPSATLDPSEEAGPSSRRDVGGMSGRVG